MRMERRVISPASIMDSSMYDAGPVELQKSVYYNMPAGRGLLSNLLSYWTCYGGFSLWESYY